MTSVPLELAEVVGPLAAVVTAAGVVTGLVVLLATGRGLLALRVALELWTAAGLLRLGADAELPAILTAATVLGLRQLVSYAQRHPAAAGGSAGSRTGGASSADTRRSRGRGARWDWGALVVPQWAASRHVPGKTEPAQPRA